MLSDDFIGRVALDASRAGIPTRDQPIGVEHVERIIGNAGDQQAELPLAVTQRFFCLAPRGDVAGDFCKSGNFSVVSADCVDHHGCKEAGAILANAPILRLEPSFACCDCQCFCRRAGGALFRRIEHAEMPPDDFLGGVPLDALGAGIPVGDDTARVEQVDGIIGHALNQHAKMSLAVGQGPLRGMSLGEVPGDLRKADKCPGLVVDGIKNRGDPEPGAVLADPPAFGLEAADLPRLRERFLRQPGVPVLPGEELREVPADDFVRCVAFHPFGAGIPACDDALGREHVQGVVGNTLDQELEPRRIAGAAAGGRGNSRSDGFSGHGPQHWRRRLSALSSNSDRSEASPTHRPRKHAGRWPNLRGVWCEHRPRDQPGLSVLRLVSPRRDPPQGIGLEPHSMLDVDGAKDEADEEPRRTAGPTQE